MLQNVPHIIKISIRLNFFFNLISNVFHMCMERKCLQRTLGLFHAFIMKVLMRNGCKR